MIANEATGNLFLQKDYGHDKILHYTKQEVDMQVGILVHIK